MMTKTFYVLLSALLLLPACCWNAEKKGNHHTYFVQATLDSETIKNLQSTLTPVIDNIIQEELGIEQDKGFPVFLFKKRQAVTIYYINDLYDNQEPIAGLMYLFVEPTLNSLQPSAPQSVALSSKTDFFGEEKKGLFGSIDLVTLVDDPTEELASFNTQMKKAMHHANSEYKRAYHIDLYDIKKSERHSYLPHITLGHLRANYIKHLVNDASKADAILARIKQRILETISDALSNLSPENRALLFDSVAIYNAKIKKYAKQLPLKPNSGTFLTQDKHENPVLFEWKTLQKKDFKKEVKPLAGILSKTFAEIEMQRFAAYPKDAKSVIDFLAGDKNTFEDLVRNHVMTKNKKTGTTTIVQQDMFRKKITELLKSYVLAADKVLPKEYKEFIFLSVKEKKQQNSLDAPYL